MNTMKKKWGWLALILFFTLFLPIQPAQAEEDANWISVAGRVTTIVPSVLVRGTAFFLEGVIDGVIEGLSGRKAFLHGESKYF